MCNSHSQKKISILDSESIQFANLQKYISISSKKALNTEQYANGISVVR